MVTEESEASTTSRIPGIVGDQGEPEILWMGGRGASGFADAMAPSSTISNQLHQDLVGSETDFGEVAGPDGEASLEGMPQFSLDVRALDEEGLKVQSGPGFGRFLQDDGGRIDVGLRGRRRGEQDEQSELAQHPHGRTTGCDGRKAKQSLLLALLLPLFVLLTGRAEAQSYAPSELVGLSSARAALGTDGSALYANPAGLAGSRKYLARLEYGDDIRGEDRRFHVSITDGQTGPVAGGLAVTYGVARPRGSVPDSLAPANLRLRGFRVDGALAIRAGDRVRLGVAGRGYLFNLKNGDEVLGDGPRRFSIDVGLQAQLSNLVYLGLVGRNLTRPDDPEIPLQAGGGLGVRTAMLELEADLLYDDFTENVLFLTGTAVKLAEVFTIRLGTEYDAGQGEFGMGFGGGAQIGRLGIEAGYAQRFTGLDFKSDDERIFSVGLTLEVF